MVRSDADLSADFARLSDYSIGVKVAMSVRDAAVSAPAKETDNEDGKQSTNAASNSTDNYTGLAAAT
jgi:hypothetical protein